MNVLFLCTGNSCRSQMAEGFARNLMPEHKIYSAGISSSHLNKIAVEVMKEKGIDISGQHSKNLADLDDISMDLVVTVCDHASQNCPIYPGNVMRLHKSFADPPKLAEKLETEESIKNVYRKVRDEIEEFVKNIKKQYGA